MRQDIREVPACRACDAEVVRAPMGDKVIAGGAYGSYLVSDLVVGKYWDSPPLNRQAQQLERLKLSIPSSSMADQIALGDGPAAPHLRPAANRGAARGRNARRLDEHPGARQRQSPRHPRRVALGVRRRHDVRGLSLHLDGQEARSARGRDGPSSFLALRKGPVVADAANLFDASFESGERARWAATCTGGATFVKALDAGDARATNSHRRLPGSLRRGGRGAARATRSATRRGNDDPSLSTTSCSGGSMRTARSNHRTPLLGAALRYIDNHRVALTRFLDDGALPIDNGIVERLHRRPAIGRRNYLFAGSTCGRRACRYRASRSARLLPARHQPRRVPG